MTVIFIIQSILILLLILVIRYVCVYQKSLKLEKRIAKYSIESRNDKQIPLFETLSEMYKDLLNNTSTFFLRYKSLVNYSKRYSKYISYDKPSSIKTMDYVSNKFFIGIAFLIIFILSKLFENNFPSILELIIVGFLGFYLLDIYFVISDMIKRKMVEQELLNAIIIMNNAFRSGRSTIQAIEIVATELSGPIKQEFKKMQLEIGYGLSLDTVFERFSKRVNLEEVKYITSSLTILNKTGGNIIKVFASIEKMLFDKRKLKKEMNSLTSASKLISRILLLMPIAFILFIFILDPTYFTILFTNIIGRVILFLTVMLYIIYIVVVVKIMKVRI